LLLVLVVVDDFEIGVHDVRLLLGLLGLGRLRRGGSSAGGSSSRRRFSRNRMALPARSSRKA